MSGSVPAPGQETAASILDFLYHDARRVGSFLGQLVADGVPQSTKQVREIASSSAGKTSSGAELNLKVVKASGSEEDAETTSVREGAERIFDPFWTNAMTFLDAIDGAGLLHRDVASAGIGQFVLIDGSLIIANAGMMKGAWEKPSIHGIVTSAGTANEPTALTKSEYRNDRKASRAHTPEQKAAQLGAELLSLVPHTTQGWMVNQGIQYWFPLRDEAMVTSADDLFLKYGAYLGKGWKVVGVLDARPDDVDVDKEIDLMIVGATSNIAQMMVDLSIVTRPIFGRAPVAYGITPLVIYRQVA